MIPIRLQDIAAATGGQLFAPGEQVVTGPVVVDSRDVEPGSLFVAFAGEHVDGHDFAAAAVGAGAVAVLGARLLSDQSSSDATVAPLPMIVVEDPQAALGALARFVRSQLNHLTVIGVTGSSGKTSTKDLLAQVLGELGETVAPRNSFNNEIGVPLTLLRCTEKTRYLVAELGARHPGNITYLCDVVQPDLGVVINVGTAHLGEFGTREITAATKGELIESLPAQGTAILNADDALVSAMDARTDAEVIRVGFAHGADLRPGGVSLDAAARASFDLLLHGAQTGPRVNLKLHGRHHVGNALAVAAVAWRLGMSLDDVARALSQAEALSGGRMTVITREDGVVIIDDAYNANPDSVSAALAALGAMTAADTGDQRRSWAVLGEMRELGPEAAREHAQLGVAAVAGGVHRLIAVGAQARAYLDDVDPAQVHPTSGQLESDSAGQFVAYAVADAAEAESILRAELRRGDVVLCKASRAVGLDVLAARLRTVDTMVQPTPLDQESPAIPGYGVSSCSGGDAHVSVGQHHESAESSGPSEAHPEVSA